MPCLLLCLCLSPSKLAGLMHLWKFDMPGSETAVGVRVGKVAHGRIGHQGLCQVASCELATLPEAAHTALLCASLVHCCLPGLGAGRGQCMQGSAGLRLWWVALCTVGLPPLSPPPFCGDRAYFATSRNNLESVLLRCREWREPFSKRPPPRPGQSQDPSSSPCPSLPKGRPLPASS